MNSLPMARGRVSGETTVGRLTTGSSPHLTRSLVANAYRDRRSRGGDPTLAFEAAYRIHVACGNCAEFPVNQALFQAWPRVDP